MNSREHAGGTQFMDLSRMDSNSWPERQRSPRRGRIDVREDFGLMETRMVRLRTTPTAAGAILYPGFKKECLGQNAGVYDCE